MSSDLAKSVAKRSTRTTNKVSITHKENIRSMNNEAQSRVKQEMSKVLVPESLWRTHLDNMKKMRDLYPAPVDTVGCDRLYDPKAEPAAQRFQILLSLLMSSQTKDHVNAEAMKNLKEFGCTVQNLSKTSVSTIQNLIRSVGFAPTKAANIVKICPILIEKYNGDIPSTLEELMELPGIGPKMAHLVMMAAWNQVTGIAVDTHVHRIANWLKWVNTKTPVATQSALEDLIPKSDWRQVNHTMVGFGQTVCSKRNPKCEVCLNRSICPIGKKVKVKQKNEDVKEYVKEELF